jgi:acyl carrier protein
MNEKLQEILAEVFELKTSEITQNLTKEDLSNWDSLTQMDLVTSLENGFDIEFEIMEIVQLVSVEKIIEILYLKDIDLVR